MSRKNKKLPLLEHVTIETVAAEGNCLFHDGEQVVFVPYCIPGDVCDVQIVKKKHRYCEGRVVRLIEPAPLRTEPMCPHFGICGGCRWQILPYEEQLKAKQKQVMDQLTRIGKVTLPACRPILGSVKTREYRNKLEFGCCNRRWFTKEELSDPTLNLDDNHSAIGFHIAGAFDKIYPIRECKLMDDFHNRVRNDIEKYARDNGIVFYDIRVQKGLLRDLIFRNSNTGEWMLIIQFHFDETGGQAEAEQLMQHIVDTFPEITSLIWLDNQKGNDSIGDQELHTFHGTDFIYETMEDLRFKVGPKSFYQTNTDQAYHLYSVARYFAFAPLEEIRNYQPEDGVEVHADRLPDYQLKSEPEELPLIYDLYTGTGTIANFVARRAEHVVGIEYVPEAIEDAKINSKINHIDNTEFYAGDMKKILTDDFISQHGRPDIIITDPPRAGMDQEVVDVILNAAPRRIVYVSCNPATQARDLQLMDTAYEVQAVQPVDMFPHTPHVENVVLLTKRD